MGRIVADMTFEVTPLVQIREKGKVFVGTKTIVKPGKKPGSQIHLFRIAAGTTADTVKPTGAVDEKGAKVYATCQVDLNDEVAIFGDTQLNGKLATVKEGEVVKITSTGKQQTKSGNWMNSYVIEVL
jgi:hypothetical protein